jgi:flavin reductase (DIM6/NTAB) family NADH-FMN oxidoreductase RutF
MFYEPRLGNHGLPHDPMLACIAPRPIGWISTLSRDGVPNLAPFSFFNGVQDRPPVVMFVNNGPHRDGLVKDSAINAEETGEFVVNLATWDLRDQVVTTAAHVPRGTDEFALAGLETAPSRLVKPPRVAASPIHLECVFRLAISLPRREAEWSNRMVFGEVVGVHINETVLTNGMVDTAKTQPLVRLGYLDYAAVRDVFQMRRPD